MNTLCVKQINVWDVKQVQRCFRITTTYYVTFGWKHLTNLLVKSLNNVVIVLWSVETPNMSLCRLWSADNQPLIYSPLLLLMKLNWWPTFLYVQDEKLTVTQAASVPGNPSMLRFHYQLSERRSAFWDTALSEDSLFLEIPAGPLVEGSKEGWVAPASPWNTLLTAEKPASLLPAVVPRFSLWYFWVIFSFVT